MASQPFRGREFFLQFPVGVHTLGTHRLVHQVPILQPVPGCADVRFKRETQRVRHLPSVLAAGGLVLQSARFFKIRLHPRPESRTDGTHPSISIKPSNYRSQLINLPFLPQLAAVGNGRKWPLDCEMSGSFLRPDRDSNSDPIARLVPRSLCKSRLSIKSMQQ